MSSASLEPRPTCLSSSTKDQHRLSGLPPRQLTTLLNHAHLGPWLLAGRMFAHVLEVAVAVPRELPTHRFLRARFISFVHRMVEGLQAGAWLQYTCQLHTLSQDHFASAHAPPQCSGTKQGEVAGRLARGQQGRAGAVVTRCTSRRQPPHRLQSPTSNIAVACLQLSDPLCCLPAAGHAAALPAHHP
jgi:hypothetical protein